MQNYLRVGECAKRLGILPKSVRAVIYRGNLPHIVQYGIRVVGAQDLEVYARTRKRGRPGKTEGGK